MVRVMTSTERDEAQFSNQMVVYEDQEEMRRQFYETVEKEKLQQKSAEEVQLDVEFEEAAFLGQFFGLDDELGEAIQNGDLDYVNTVLEVSCHNEEVEKMIEKATVVEQEVMQEEINDGLKIIEELKKDEEDPLGAKRFEQATTKVLTSRMHTQEESRVGIEVDDPFEYKSNKKDSYYNTQTSRSDEPYRRTATTRTSEPVMATESVAKDSSTTMREQRKARREFYNGAANDVKELTVRRNQAMAEKTHARIDKKRKGKRRQKLTLRSAFTSVKSWFGSHDAADLFKVGTLICMETALAILTGKHEFEGKGQLMAFLGLMTGLYYIGQKVVEIGFDPRVVKF